MSHLTFSEPLMVMDVLGKSLRKDDFAKGVILAAIERIMQETGFTAKKAMSRMAISEDRRQEYIQGLEKVQNKNDI